MSATQTTQAKEYTKVRIRWMIRQDMPEVLLIEQASFQKPWIVEDFLCQLRCNNVIGMVAEVGDKVVGYMVYELHTDCLLLINLAVHPECRNQGIGYQLMARLKSKIDGKPRTKLVALVPQSHENVQSFFQNNGIEFRFTKQKGVVTYKPVLKAMTKDDAKEAQFIEDDFMVRYGKTPRDIGDLITNGTRYGIVARDKDNGELLGYVLYTRELSGIDVNGEYGIIINGRCRRQGIGRKLMTELASQNLPITVSDIYLLCKDQVGFLSAMGVPVPKIQKFVTIKWDGKPPSAK